MAVTALTSLGARFERVLHGVTQVGATAAGKLRENDSSGSLGAKGAHDQTQTRQS